MRMRPGNRAPGYSLGQREFLSYDRRVKITMSVTLAPELAEAIEESAERQGLSFDDWLVAAAELKFRADDEAAIFEEAEEKRRRARLLKFIDEVFAESVSQPRKSGPRGRGTRRSGAGLPRSITPGWRPRAHDRACP